MDMKDFDAKQAREIVETRENRELYLFLQKIKAEAEKGYTEFNIYQGVSTKTIIGLIERGFKVHDAGPISMQKDGLFYIVKW